MLYGSDWPGPGTPSMGANMREFRALPLPPEVFEEILDRTPTKVFG